MARYRFVVAATLGCLFALQASAHHSFAAYDMTTTKTISGTLKEIDWSAPHSSFTVSYTNEKGEEIDVPVSTGAPSVMVQQGFNPRDFKVGMKVELTWHPQRNGLPGGDLASLKLQDGRVLNGGGGFGPPADKAPAAK